MDIYLRAESTNTETELRIILSLSQSGMRSASSLVSTRYARGSSCPATSTKNSDLTKDNFLGSYETYQANDICYDGR